MLSDFLLVFILNFLKRICCIFFLYIPKLSFFVFSGFIFILLSFPFLFIISLLSALIEISFPFSNFSFFIDSFCLNSFSFLFLPSLISSFSSFILLFLLGFNSNLSSFILSEFFCSEFEFISLIIFLVILFSVLYFWFSIIAFILLSIWFVLLIIFLFS